MVIPRVLVRLSSLLGAKRPIVKSSYVQTRFPLHGAVFLVLMLLPLYVIRDFWPVDQHHLHINVKEALALANASDAFSSSLRDSWIDVYTDSQVLIASWRRQGSKSCNLADVFKRTFQIVSTYNIHLNLFYISSADNPADTPSRVFPLQDSISSPFAWAFVQAEFGGRSGHSADLMALPSNLQCALDGSPLPFFSPYPLPGSSGVNLFAQRPDNHGCLFSNPYVFPPLF